MNARWSLHGSAPRSSPFRSSIHRASGYPGRTRAVALNAGVLLALLLSLVMPVGGFAPAPVRAAEGLSVSISADFPVISLGDTLAGSWSFTDPLGESWTATVDYGEGGSTFLGSVEPGTPYPLEYTYAYAGDKTVMVEVSDGTNTASEVVMVTVNLPDIIPTGISVNGGAPVSPGDTITIGWSDTNAGPGDIVAWTSWTDTLYLSTDATLDGGDTWLAEHSLAWMSRIPSGESVGCGVELTLPEVSPGDYTVFVVADASSSVMEAEDGNNTVSTALTLQDVVTNNAPVADPGGPYTAGVDEWIPLDGSWSYDPDGDPLLDYAWDIDFTDGIFEPTYYGTTVWVGYATAGTYTVALQVRDSLYLPSEIVTTTVTVTVPRPDLAPGLYSVYPAQVEPGGNMTVYWGNTNAGGGTIPSGTSWIDQIYLSTDTVLGDANDVYLGDYTFTLTDDLWMYVTVDASLEVTIPAETPQGAYFILLKADSGDAIVETSEGNNVTSLVLNIGTPQYDLVIESVTPAVTEAKVGDQVLVSWAGRNDGSFTILNGWWYDEVYISADTTLDGSDIDTYIGWQGVSATLAAGETYTSSVQVTIPMWITPGTYYILVNADAINYVAETNESNNVLASGPITITALNVDLAPISMTPSATTVVSGDQFTIDVEVVNNGPDAIPASAGWSSVIYLSTDDTLDPAADREFAYRWEDGPLAAGATRTSTLYVMGVPFDIPDGAYTLFLVTDASGALAETEEGNNVLPTTVTITIDALDFDLEPVNIVPAATEVMIGETLPITWTDANIGEDAIPDDRDWYDTVHLTTDPTGETGGMYLLDHQFTGASLVDGQVSFTAYPTISSQVQPGTYYLLLEVDRYSNIDESDEMNNRLVSEPITITVPKVDLVPVSIDTAATSVELEDSFSVTVSMQNTGPDAVPPDMSWRDTVYLSTDETFDPDVDFAVGSFYRGGGLQVNGPLTADESCFVSAWYGPPAGTYHLLLVVDSDGNVTETHEENNVLPGGTIEVRARDVDLVPEAVSLGPEAAMPGDLVTVTWSVGNDGTSYLPYASGWTDEIYLSADRELDATDARVLSLYNYTAPAPGEAITNQLAFAVPQVIPDGNYYLILQVDRWNNVPEAEEGNNVLATEGTLTVTNGVSVDLEPTVFTVDPIAGTTDDALSLAYTVINHGPDALPEAWHTDLVYISRDEVLDEGDRYMAEFGISEMVDADGTYMRTVTVYLPWNEEPGPAFLILSVNHYDSILETGATNNTLAIPFTVTEEIINEPPVAEANGPYYVDEGSTVIVDGTGSYDPEGSSLKFEWDLHEDGVIDATGMQPTLSAEQLDGPADLLLLLTVQDDEGLVGSDYPSFFVNNVAPTVEAGVDATIVAGLAYTGIGSFTDPGAADTHMATVDYGDGAGPVELILTDMSFSLDHNYATAGTYTVTVTVTDDDGGVGSDQLTVTVNNAEANVVPTVGPITAAPASPAANGVVQVTAPFTDANFADTHTATVSWGDGSGTEAMTVTEGGGSGTATASHTYATKGKYTITVTVSDGDLDGTATLAVRVTPAPAANTAPVAVPGGPYAVMVGDTLTLDGSGSYDPNNNLPLTWEWDTDYDGGTFIADLTGMTPATSYGATGEYTVALRVTDSLGLASAIATTTVTVTETPLMSAPVVGPVTVTPARVDAGALVSMSTPYTDAHPGYLHMATINWGDGTGDMPATAWGGMVSGEHTYTAKGKYTITVTVSYEGLSDYATARVQVVPAPRNTAPPTLTTQQAPVIEEPTMAPPIPTPEPTPVPEVPTPEPTIVPEPTPEPTPLEGVGDGTEVAG